MTERETVHYGPIEQCRTHWMSQDCGRELPDCIIEKMPMEPPMFRFMTEPDNDDTAPGDAWVCGDGGWHSRPIVQPCDEYCHCELNGGTDVP